MDSRLVSSVCPYLGQCDAPDSYYAFPTDGNCCYTEQHPAPIDTFFQTAACLGKEWTACPRYRSATRQSPAEVPFVPPVRRSVPKISRRSWIPIVAVAVAGLLIVWFLVLRPSSTGEEPLPATLTLVALQSQTATRTLSTATMPLERTSAPDPMTALALTSRQPSVTLASTASPALTETAVAPSTTTATSSTVPTPTLIATSTPMPTDTPTPTATLAPFIYVIKRGDSLSSIALQFGVTVQEIQQANGIADPQHLSVGRKIIIPARVGGGELTAVATPTPLPTTPGPTPTPLPAPILLAPTERQEFSEKDEVVLVWQAVNKLPADAYYAISVVYQHEGKVWYDEVPWTQDTRWVLSQHRYLLDLSDNGEFQWSVQVMRQSGEDAAGKPTGRPLSPPSAVRTLLWRRTSGGGGGTPLPPPP